MMAQSAFRCSLLETLASESSGSAFAACPAGFACPGTLPSLPVGVGFTAAAGLSAGGEADFCSRSNEGRRLKDRMWHVTGEHSRRGRMDVRSGDGEKPDAAHRQASILIYLLYVEYIISGTSEGTPRKADD